MTALPSLDLSACEREPIRIPGRIQPHGVLLVLGADGRTILQASANAAEVLGVPAESALGRDLAEVLPPEADRLLAALPEAGAVPRALGVIVAQGATFAALAHRLDGLLLLELERIAGDAESLDTLYPELRGTIEVLQAASSFEALSGLLVREVRRLTGFDRVMAYRFDEDWNGTVVAEDRGEGLPSYLDLRFPASDIPAQARELYRLNRLRIIPDATYDPVPLLPPDNPVTRGPLDLGQAALRSVSPVHLEYMRNMGTGSSMSVSVLVEGRLWGLVSCHSRDPHHVPPARRAACDLLGQVYALRLAAQEQVEAARHRVELQAVQARLLAQMAGEGDFLDALVAHPEELLQVAGAEGAAVVTAERCDRVGQSPSEADIRRITEWLRSSGQDVVATDRLPLVLPEVAGARDTAAGLLAVSISKLHSGWVMWFRPEVLRTVRWGGDPAKPVAPGKDRLHPRRSFAIWSETVRDRALPWQAAEVETVSALRNAIVGIVLRKAEELAELAQELARSNRELEAFSYSVSHDLRAPFRHIVGFAELLRESGPEPLSPERLRHLDIIAEAAHSAGRLVDGLLNYSQMGRTAILPVGVDMNRMVAEVLRSLAPDCDGRDIDWVVGDLPRAAGDPVMLRQAWVNLIGNAIKYTRPKPRARIEIGAVLGPGEIAYFVRDDGVGFDMAYVGKLFGVFQRLHRVEEFEGTGIGLANVRRIAERHEGRVWAEGVRGEGATFWLALPRGPGGGT